MNRKVIMILLALVLSTTLVACGSDKEKTSEPEVSPAVSQEVVEAPTVTLLATTDKNATTISLKRAKEIALEHAGLKAEEVTFYKAKMDYDNGRSEYEIEFYKGNTEYDYEIDATTGKINSFDQEIENRKKPSTKPSETTKIGLKKAKSIALKHAGLTEKDVTFIKAKLDYDDGRTVYDVEFYKGNKEYDYEIDAFTGKVKSYDYEIETWNKPNTTPNKGLISIDKAKSIALKHSGYTSTQVAFYKEKLDYDDGRQTYEIEFYKDNKEYDYEIDAVTGEIVGYDFDIENFKPVYESNANKGDIGIEKAKSIALAKVSGASASNMRIYPDYDDGYKVYEGKIIHNLKEYEFEIDAATGRINEWDVDSIYD